MYTFSNDTVAEFYRRKFYSITNAEGELVAYSENVFDVPEQVKLYPGKQTLIFGDAVIWGGNFHGGYFHGGYFRGGNFHGGYFHGGDFYGGNFYGGDFYGGNFHGGNFYGGNFYGGDFHGGYFRGGYFRGGYFYGGDFHGGDFHGGNFYGGNFHGGNFHGGYFRGGYFRGGYFRGGYFYGGNFHGGDFRTSPLQIQGSRNFCYVSNLKEDDQTEIGIGCKRYPISYWLENFQAIGEGVDYTQEEIAEYGEYIRIYAKKYAPGLLQETT